jgi:IS5 family transposase
VCEKGYRGAPLTEDQRRHNRQKSKIRALVEHVFGFMENSMNGIFIRCIGIKRATCQIGLANLTYNICRYVQLIRLNRVQRA